MGIGGVVALGTGLGAPLAAALGMSATAVTMMQIFIDNNDNTLPSQLLGFEIWGNPTIYENEDDDTEGVWSADLAAQSNGWTLDWPTTLGNIPGLGKAAGILNKTKIPNVVEFLIDNFQREANNIWKADSGPINISPQMLQVTIDVNRDEDYFNWELNTKSQETNVDPFSFTQDKQGYTPEAVGTADLRIETKGGDVFKGQNAFNEVDLEVVGINITLVEFVADSDTTYVSPIYIGVDEELTLEAAVENARNKEVAWSVSPEESGLSLTDWHVEPATGIKDVIAKDPGRYTVEVESTADTGPRADKNPRRFDWVTIVVGGLNVSNPGCLQPGETSQLKASIGGESVDFSELEWDINGPGSIDSEGVFTANETGTVEIDFYLSDYSEMTYSINFRIDETCRTFTLSSAEFEISGTCVYFDESGGASNSTGIYFGTRLDDISGSITLHTLLKETMPEDEAWTVSDPEWQISSAVNIKTSTTFPWSNWVHLANEPPGPFSITIEHDVINNGRTLSGSFKGEYEFVDYSDDESIHRIETVEGSFRGATRSVPSECF
ncbi:MAG: hypothetical protein R6V22_05125 [Rhodohalobacter sp.]|uniref:hypothetical protein n=1 Tax=Rhodohalobacter sp. TaxID=1974210 RepID=UPI003975DA94